MTFADVLATELEICLSRRVPEVTGNDSDQEGRGGWCRALVRLITTNRIKFYCPSKVVFSISGL